MSEKTEKASPHKLQKAKEQGQVSKSTELNTCIVLLVLLLSASALYPQFLLHIKELMRQILHVQGRMPLSVGTIGNLYQYLFTKLTLLWLPFAMAGMLSIIIATIAQTGFVWSGKPITPDFKRLDLVKGFKRLLSTKLLFEAGKNSLKLGLVILLLFLSMKHELNTFLGFMSTTPHNALPLLMKLIFKIVLQLLSLLFAIAMLDKLYTRWKFAKEQRMSKQELKDEYKQREGDPKIKAKIKQLQNQLRQKTASLEQVKTADVVITNPTHLAIALKYDRGLMPAPKVVCKVQGELVKQVKLIASRHQVPIIENKLFARALFSTIDLNQWIYREHFPIAALIFREIYRQKESA